MKGKILHTCYCKFPLKPLQKAMKKVSRPLKKKKNPKNITRKHRNVHRLFIISQKNLPGKTGQSKYPTLATWLKLQSVFTKITPNDVFPRLLNAWMIMLCVGVRGSYIGTQSQII